MKHFQTEHYIMMKPYPIIKIVRDGYDLVFSLGKWYWRFYGFFGDWRTTLLG